MRSLAPDHSAFSLAWSWLSTLLREDLRIFIRTSHHPRPMPRILHATQTRDSHPASLTKNLRGRGCRSRSAQGILESHRRWMFIMRGRQSI
ncbi:Cutinase transcription factor 1 alpha [Fusarium oxysporum f. sp. albedinis]|nr:Cutinase transcription factor 1 alpha [Fusarium oxysporum f. sp. albedinis]